MLASRPFAVFQERVTNALLTASGDCEREDDELKLRRAQGRAAALRMVLALPAHIKAEMRPKGKS